MGQLGELLAFDHRQTLDSFVVHLQDLSGPTADPARKDIEIVGIVPNSSIGNVRSTAPPVMYRPALQEGRFGLYPLVFIAAQGDLSTIAEPVRQTIRAMGREYVHEIVPLRQRLLEVPRVKG